MKIAVTGATGFLGRHVMSELDRRSVSTVPVCRSGSKLGEGIQPDSVVEIDVLHPPGDAFDRMGRPECLIHLAWGGLPNYTSLHHFREQLPAHFEFLHSLLDAGLQSLLVSGTCFEYGMQSGPLDEEMDTCPANPYGFAKDSLRRQLEFLRAVRPFNLVWARLFYLWGEGQAPGSLFPLLKSAVEEGKQTFKMSGGEQLRDYLPVDLAAKHLVDLAMRGEDTGVINVCSGEPVSIRKLVEGWITEHGWSIRLDLGYYPYPTYEPLAFWGNRAKLDSVADLDW